MDIDIVYNIDKLANVRDNCEQYLLHLQSRISEIKSKQLSLSSYSSEYKQLNKDLLNTNMEIDKYLNKLSKLNSEILEEIKEIK